MNKCNGGRNRAAEKVKYVGAGAAFTGAKSCEEEMGL